MKLDVPHRYEGPEVLQTLLDAAGCVLDVTEVREEFEASIEEDVDTPPATVLPLLFEEEPRFRDAADARRLYMNLLGLWHEVRDRALGRLPIAAPPAPPRPPPGAVEGREVPADYVMTAWETLVEGGPGEQRRAEDRLENLQGELVDWLRSRLGALDIPTSVEEAAVGLCVGTHEAWRLSFGERRTVALGWRALDAAHRRVREGAGESQPALARLQGDALDEAFSEGEPSPADDVRSAIEAVLAAVRLAFTDSLD